MAPTYEYQCPDGHIFTRYLVLKEHQAFLDCDCGMLAAQRISVPLLVTATPDVCYDSPIDGRPITSWDARLEDMKRADCIPYDPEMKTDATHQQASADASLEASLERTVEERIEKMSGAQRRQLASEVLDQGADLAYTRTTPHD